MNNNLLYFPYIDIPQNNWTIKSILYWDKVGIIVPPAYLNDASQFNKYTSDLIESDLIEQIFPSREIWKLRSFDENFIKLISQKKFNLKRRQQNFKEDKIARIHFQKFGDELLYRLEKMKIAKRVDWQWFYIESKTAKLLMLYLATIIAELRKYTPATDSIKNLDTSLSQSGYSTKLTEIRHNLLDDLIPYPIDPNLTKLRKFKDKYHEELTSFRILLEKSVFDIGLIESSDLRDTKKNLVLAEINDKRKKILSDLNQSRFAQITFGTICGLTGAAIGFSQGNKILGTFSLANAVYSALQGYDNKSVLSRDYAYLALIDKKLS